MPKGISTHMTPSDRALKIGTNIGRGVEIYGFKIWEIICDTMPLDIPFSREDVADEIARQCNISRRYARDLAAGVLMTVEDEGHGVAKRVGYRWVI